VEFVLADRLLDEVPVDPATELQGEWFKPDVPDIEGLLSPLVPEGDPGVAEGLAPVLVPLLAPAPELLPLAPPPVCAKAVLAVPMMRMAASNPRVVPLRMYRLLLRSPNGPTWRGAPKFPSQLVKLSGARIPKPPTAIRRRLLFAVAAPGRFAGDAKFFRLRAKRRRQESLRGEATLEQLADCRGSARHALPEAEIVEDRQFVARQHDLQAFSTCRTVRHLSPHLDRFPHTTNYE